MTGLLWRREYIQFKRGVRSIMVGRKRKLGKREANGRVARAYENPRAQVAAQPHRSGVVVKLMREWPEAETMFGRLMLNGRITPAQYEAGKLYATLSEQVRRTYTPLPMHPSGIDLLRVSGGGYDGEVSPEYVERIRKRLNSAFEACGGTRVARVVKRYAIEDVSDGLQFDLLKTGLDNLVAFFGIDKHLQIVSRQKCRVS